MTADLIAFLRARLDEDEAAALACPGDRRWPVGLLAQALPEPGLGMEQRAHIARHDPARVLREVEAKREVVRLAERAHDYHETFMNGFAAAMEQALRKFALAYADHPDFREEWRP